MPQDGYGLLTIHTLRKRASFQALRAGQKKVVMPGFVLQYLPLSALPESEQEALDKDGIAVGFTVTKRQGNAVKRNRIKRRLRAVVQQVFPHEVRPGYAYVLIGRWQTPDLPFDDLLTQASRALSKIPAAASESSESSHK